MNGVEPRVQAVDLHRITEINLYQMNLISE